MTSPFPSLPDKPYIHKCIGRVGQESSREVGKGIEGNTNLKDSDFGKVKKGSDGREVIRRLHPFPVNSPIYSTLTPDFQDDN